MMVCCVPTPMQSGAGVVVLAVKKTYLVLYLFNPSPLLHFSPSCTSCTMS